MAASWLAGRQLARMQSVDIDASFVYNENGLRVQKTVNGVVTNYTLHGKNVVHLSRENDELHFFYDAQNKPAVVVYNGTPYSYVKNLQGDIVAILNSAGTAVVNYVYDAWGRLISKTGSMAGTLGTVQPFRYRGYVYDEETEVYYLRSRYYKPVWCRFVNTDVLLGFVGNLFSHNQCAYCNNNPVMLLDSSGTKPTLFYFYGKDQEKHAERNIKALNADFEVTPYLVTSEDQFITKWNEMLGKVSEGEIDVVVINVHGSAYTAEYVKLSKMSFPVRINTFVLLSCNVGHQSTGNKNFAESLLDSSNGQIDNLVATDGSHCRGTFWHPFRGIQVKESNTWRLYCNDDSAQSQGFVLYTTTSSGERSISSIGYKFSSVKDLLSKVGW